MDERNFTFLAAKLAQHLDESKAVELENGVTFRKVFFTRLQGIKQECEGLCKDTQSCKDNKEQITRTALLFGELLCNMKIKKKVNPIYRSVIENFIGVFLTIASEETVSILSTLLKLVGPELD